MDYYQLGGFEASIHSHPMFSLGEKVYEVLRQQQHPGDEGLGLSLVLGALHPPQIAPISMKDPGIKSAGTSHVLITRDERDAIHRESIKFDNAYKAEFAQQKFKNEKEREEARAAMYRTFLRFPRGRVALGEFESLSPIFLPDMDALSTKLDSLTPAKVSTHDNSRANRAYQDTHVAYVVQRGQFENSRVVYLVLQNQISRNLRELGDTSWRTSLRVFSFCCNIWANDLRSPWDRKTVPKVLDIGWCEAGVPSLEPEEKTQRHLVLKENRQLSNSGKIDPYEYGETELCSLQSATQRLQSVFAKFAQPLPYPTILLVHDVQATISVLQHFGLDMALWKFDLKSLLRPGESSSQPRGRSASPGATNRSGRDSPPPRRYAPMYVVDVQALFVALLREGDTSKSVPSICKRLGLYRPKGWCAGNECWMMVDVFRAMASGKSIDDQLRDWPKPVHSKEGTRRKQKDTAKSKSESESESDYGDSNEE
ncbi:hypothetical protein C8F04DRAFT_1328459 [Mycena alexandri]|uniref:Gfd2/YDR514C-like C-terminal domain-containing protein n=1 Tax=Mycena alexandri TaxID=1745969 RepID=A0AAD6S092_9AGAR|nr:hypothetical protein C8F04DRAFT_1328459 [Mycena alexandri]